MSVFDDPGNGLTTALHRIAALLENGGTFPFYKVSELLRQAQQRIVELEESIVELEETPATELHVDRVVYVSTERAAAAIHMLHELAHGPVPFRTCQAEPCRDLAMDLPGPAPLSLPYGAA